MTDMTVLTANVYDVDGRRMAARVELSADERAYSGKLPVFCEAGLGEALPGIYGESGESIDLPEVRACRECGVLSLGDSGGARRDGECVSPCSEQTARGAQPVLTLRPAAGEKAVMRGIYALAAHERPCFARESRAIWEAMFAAWHDAGLHAYLIECDGRAQAYALLGEPTGEGDAPRFAVMREFAALPGSGIEPGCALRAAFMAGICAQDVAVRGTVICA